MSIWEKDLGSPLRRLMGLLFGRRIYRFPPTPYPARRRSLGQLFRELALAARRDVPFDTVLRAIAESDQVRMGTEHLWWAGLILVGIEVLLGLLIGWFFACFVLLIVGSLAINMLMIFPGDTFSGGVAVDLADEIQSGRSLSEAMERMPSVFTRQEHRAVAIGEKSGHLAETLDALADQSRLSCKFDLITTALMYPLTLLAIGLITIIFIRSKVIPKFVDIWMQLGAELPEFSQRVFFGLFDTFSPANPLLWIAILAIVLCIAWLMSRSLEGGRKIGWIVMIILLIAILHNMFAPSGWTRGPGTSALPFFGTVAAGVLGLVGIYYFLQILHALLPEIVGEIVSDLFGKIVPLRKAQTSQFLLSLGLSLRARLPAGEALGAAGEAVAGRLRRDARRMRRHVEQGNGVADALRLSPLLRGQTVALLSLAEWRGSLPDECVNLADELRVEAERGVERLLALTEYSCNVIAGIIIGLFVIACYLPLFNIPNLVK